jgi:hypothetical protein
MFFILICSVQVFSKHLVRSSHFPQTETTFKRFYRSQYRSWTPYFFEIESAASVRNLGREGYDELVGGSEKHLNWNYGILQGIQVTK